MNLVYSEPTVVRAAGTPESLPMLESARLGYINGGMCDSITALWCLQLE